MFFSKSISRNSFFSFSLRGEMFREIFDQVAFVAHEESSRDILRGVHFSLNQGVLTVVATDSYRIVKKRIPSIDFSGIEEFLVDVKIIRKILDYLTVDSSVYIEVHSEKVTLKTEGKIFETPLLNSRYPDYDQIFPRNAASRFTVLRDQFESATERVGRYASTHNQNVKFQILTTGDFIVFSDLNIMKETLNTHSMEGGDSIVSLSTDYVLEALRSMSFADFITIELNGKMGVVLLQAGDGLRHYIMPLKM